MSDSRLAPRSTVAELFRDHHGELVRLAAVDYRLAARNPSQQPHDVELGADPSGQHPLLTLDRPSGFLFGRIGQGKLHPLPVSLPHYGHSITAW